MLARISFAVSVFLLFTTAVQAAEYKTYNEAMAAAAKEFRARNIPATQAPLEAAVELAPNERSRRQAFQALLASYRILPDHQKFMSACEYLLDNSDSDAGRSIAARELVNFIRQRGQQDALIAHYEGRLQKNAEDRIALMVLADTYAGIKRDAETAIKHLERLTELQAKDGGKPNVRVGGDLGLQYVAAKRFEDAAKTYEQIAPVDETMTAWYWKEAAVAWKSAGDKAKSLAAAQKAVAAPPEKRSELLIYFWNDAIGDIFAEHGDKAKAKSHYEAALASTKIDGQKKKMQEKLSALQ